MQQQHVVRRVERLSGPWSDLEGELGRTEKKFKASTAQVRAAEKLYGADISKKRLAHLCAEPLSDLTLVVEPTS